MDGDECPAEDFLVNGEESTQAARSGLYQKIEIIAERGLDGVPSAWFHEANKREKIYELIQGPLRLFFFKGKNGQIAVCTTGVRKSGQKADTSAVAAAAKWRGNYFAAYENNSLEIHDET